MFRSPNHVLANIVTPEQAGVQARLEKREDGAARRFGQSRPRFAEIE
jgi:hypothetical protein